jgi:glycosyltransferase involved in cell wall biosynthesis
LKAYLWIIDLTYSTRLHHGGLLRYVNLSRELVAQGHSVTFAVCFEDDPERGREWMESLCKDGVCTNYCEFVIPPLLPRWRRLATLLLPFGLHGLAIRPFVEQSTAAIESVLKQFPADLVIVSSRQLLFTAHNLRTRPCVGDFSDSITLYFWRELTNSLRLRRFRAVARSAWGLFHFFFQEMYSSRRYAANIVVSPVDKHVFDLMGKPEKNVCIMNGVRGRPDTESVSKIDDQIVFSGAMNFPPNHDGAIWFLDKVFPTVLQKFPDLTFVIAGANPLETLIERAGPNVKVLGYVPDLNMTLAQSALYVAPLITGSGFKNKVAEAIANGTYVVGTSFAAEFLEPSMRELITVRDDPREMADAICDFLSAPERMNIKLRQLRQIVRERFSWPAKAAELARLADSVISRLPVSMDQHV